MQKRKIDELITHFNRKVSDMDIDMKYKMELLGMITAIGFACEKEFSVEAERKNEMQINMKPSTALTILHQMLNKCRDTWEHDALVLAIEALREKQTNGNNDSVHAR